MTLNRRLILSSMGLITIVLVITALLITVLINRQFNQYVTSNQLEGMEIYYRQIGSVFEDYNEEDIVAIGTSAVIEDYYIEILSKNGDIIYASQNISATSMMGRSVSLLQMENMPMYSDIEVRSWEIQGSDDTYLLNIGYNVGDGLSDDAIRFKSSVYGGIILAFAIGMILAFFLSKLLAKPLSKEITSVSDGAKMIRSGQLNHRLSTDGSIREIKELKSSMNDMAIVLSEQEDIRKNLVATVSHEVKTPLTILKSQIDAFADGIYTPTPDRLTKCKDEILRLECLMARMDDYDSFAENNHILNLSNFSLKEELDALLTILKPQFEKKQLKLTLTMEECLMVTTDRYKIRQILYNLLSNAYKFSDKGEDIRIEVKSLPKGIYIDVINKGIVIPEEEREAIFDLRFRGAGANAKDPHGKGLGLNISDSLAKKLSSKVLLIESSTDKTVFRIVLNDLAD